MSGNNCGENIFYSLQQFKKNNVLILLGGNQLKNCKINMY